MNLTQTLLPFTGVIMILLVGIPVAALPLYFAKERKRRYIILSSLLLLLLYSQYCNEIDRVFSPTQGITNFSDLSDGIDWPLRLYKIEYSQREYVEAVVSPGKFPSLVRVSSLRSGMPAYIFDLNGNLVDSSDDNLDDPRYQDKWYKPSYSPRQQIADNPFSKIVAKQK